MVHPLPDDCFGEVEAMPEPLEVLATRYDEAGSESVLEIVWLEANLKNVAGNIRTRDLE